MARNIDPMSADSSPSTLNKNGVRRVNNLPLYIAISVLAIFVTIIALVAYKRGNQQSQIVEPSKTIHANNTQDSSRMALEVMAGRVIPNTSPKIELPKAPEPPAIPLMAIPVAVIDNPNEPPLPAAKLEELDPAIARIRNEKIQQFEEAVRAKTRIEFTTELKVSRANNEEEKLDNARRKIELGRDPEALFQARLHQMQAIMQGENKANNDGFGLLPPDSNPSPELQKDRFTLHSKVETPKTPYELLTGAVIPATLISGVKSDLPNQIIGQVSQNVYDTATGKYLLIPQGARLYGVSSSNVAYGQDVLLAAWQRIIFPDGKTLDIGSMPGSDASGNAGFRDQVNNHYVRIFGSALLMSAVVGGVSYSQSLNQGQNGSFSQPTASSAMSEALGQQLGQVTAQMIAKNLNIAPSIKIRPGYRFNIMVVKDLRFTKPYQSFDYQYRGVQ